MLPECRQNEYLYPIPLFDIDKNDIEDFADELIGFHSNFSDCFQRSESREHFYKYMVGQFGDLGRKNIETIALSVEGGAVRAMQRFVSDAQWDDDRITECYHELVSEELGHSEGAVIFDETGFVKKGGNSAGVSRQYCGSIGKVENCQVGVFATYTSPDGYAIIDKRLYLPEKWFGDDFKTKREKCGLPEDIGFRTKPQLAADMLRDIAQKGIIPFKYVLADSIYGENPDFIETAGAIPGLTYFVSVSCDTLCWLNQPVTIQKEYRYGGESRIRTVLAGNEKNPITVKELARSINDYFWYRRTVSEGTKGPITYEFAKRQVVLANKGMPRKTVWLIIKRTLGEIPEYSYSISNAMVSTRLPVFVWLSGLRWSVEQCFGETKTELGMDHYEVRKFMGWHHHILVCMLAHFFLWHLKIRLGKKSPIYYFVTTQNADRSSYPYNAT